MKPKRPNHCKKCNKVLREKNKSGYCSNCYYQSDKYKEYQKKYYQEHKEIKQ